MATVLVVDDEPTQRGMLREIAEHSGHEVAEAASLAEAEEMLEGREFELLVVDLRLEADPVSYEGLTLIQLLRDRNSPAGIVAVTKWHDNLDDSGFALGVSALVRGADQFVNLALPALAERLIDALDVALGIRAWRLGVDSSMQPSGI